jgi:hypothetical protein
MLKAYMAKHKWASLGNVENVIKEVYASKLAEIEKLMDKMRYDAAKKSAVKMAISSILKQSISS